MTVLPLLIWTLWLAVLTLFPFDFVPAAAGQPVSIIMVENGLARRAPDVVLNILLFVPFGAWLHREGSRRLVGLGIILTLTAAASALISFTLECLQLFLPSRFPSLLDLVSNTAGALGGVCAHRAWAARTTAAAARLRSRASPATMFVLLAGFAGMALMASAVLQAQTRLSNWDDSYPLLIGNERTGNRPWRGRIFTMHLTDAAMPPASLRRFADGSSPVIPGSRVATFDFVGDAPYRDTTGQSPGLGWTEGPSPVGKGGVAVSERKWLRTEGAASSIARRLRETNAFTLYVRCATDDLNQDGPARIVSNSVDPYRRNFTLGQSGPNLIFRFRTPHTGENGTSPEVSIPNVFSDDEPRDILVSYDGATLQVAVADSPHVFRTELSPGSSLAAVWYSYVPASELQTHQLAYLAVLFLPPGMLLAFFTRNSKTLFAWSALWTLGFTVVLEGTLVVVSGRTVGWQNLSTTAAVGIFVLATTNLSRTGFAPRSGPSAATVAST